MFDLKRPCVTCPFRKGVGSTFRLSPARIAEIATAPAFQCHKTVHYYEDAGQSAGNHPQQCAGLMALLHRSRQHSQIMQVARRFGSLDVEALDPRGEAYGSLAEALRAHVQGIEPAHIDMEPTDGGG